MSYNYSKKIITEIPFSSDFLADENNKTSLKANSSWIIGAAQALISKEFKLVRNSEGLIDPHLTLKEFSNTHTLEELEWFTALFQYLTTEKRSDIIYDTQSKVPNYSALVPLILAAFKMYRDVKYSEWDWGSTRMKLFVDPQLLEAVTVGKDSIPSIKERIKARDYSRLIKSGTKEGSMKPAISTTSITTKAFMNNLEYNGLPRLRKLMECQVWVAHPSIRTKYMILDVNDMDNMPEPLEQDDFVAPKTTYTPKPKQVSEELSWT